MRSVAGAFTVQPCVMSFNIEIFFVDDVSLALALGLFAVTYLDSWFLSFSCPESKFHIF